MENQLVVHKRFKTLATVMYVFSFIVMTLMGLAVLAILVGGIILAVIPVDDLLGILSSIPMNNSFEGNGFSFVFTEDVLAYINPDKTMMMLVLLVGLLSLLVILFIMILVNRWLSNLRKGQILTIENSRYIEYIGYSFVVFAIIEMLTKFMMSMFIKSSLAISELPSDFLEFFNIENTAVNININLVPVFAGILIWMIAKSLKYGAYLKDEYDATV